MSEVMTPAQRIDAAIKLEPVDRVPVAPMIDYFAARFAGMTAHEWLFDRDKQRAALQETFDRMGGWDAIMTLPISDKTLPFVYPIKSKLPGVDLPPDSTHQLLEEPVMTAEDYDRVVEKGYAAVMSEVVRRIDPRIGPEEVPIRQQQIVDDMKTDAAMWAKRGVPYLVGGAAGVAYNRFSYARSIKEFMIDLHRRPQKVKDAVAASVPDVIRSARKQVDYTGVRRIFIGDSRASNAFISPRQFAEFVFPSLKQFVDALLEAEITPLFHYDQDWLPNLPYFKQFPRGKCIMELDGFTDIFKAKELLGDHMCLMGDVPPTLLTLGTPKEVEDYCKRLIDVVGEGGGFILSSGCSVPIDAKPENVKAMIDTAKTHLPH